MNKNTVLESMYKTIKDSLEWGFDANDYGKFVDGVIAMTEAMLTEAEIEERCEKLNELDKKALDYARQYTDTDIEALNTIADTLDTTTEAISGLDMSELYNPKNYEPFCKK